MKRPLIGVTMDSGDRPGRYEIHGDYVISVEKAGGLPFLIPYGIDQSLVGGIVDLLDGVLFIGGDDLDPGLYGEAWHPKAIRVDPRRQSFELALLAEVERRRLPALGICMGCQLMNVHRGGSLHQFLPDVPRAEPIEHRRLEGEAPRHCVSMDSDSLVGRAIGKTEISVNTSHKQAVARLGRGLRVVGRAPDGVIEALEDPAFALFAGVQWHPERLHAEPEHLALFQLLVRKSTQIAGGECFSGGAVRG